MKEQLQKHNQIISIDKYYFSWTIAFYNNLDIIKLTEVNRPGWRTHLFRQNDETQRTINNSYWTCFVTDLI